MSLPASVLMVHSLNHLMPQLLALLLLNNHLYVLTVLHLTQPPASVLMVHNHNHLTRQSLALLPLSPQLVCSDGTAPDVTTGLCADGSQAQPFNATPPGVRPAEQQLVCADGASPDPTTGLCADGSQPQPVDAVPGVTTAEPQLVS